MCYLVLMETPRPGSRCADALDALNIDALLDENQRVMRQVTNLGAGFREECWASLRSEAAWLAPCRARAYHSSGLCPKHAKELLP